MTVRGLKDAVSGWTMAPALICAVNFALIFNQLIKKE